jgi:hypothetical protein
MPEVAVHILPSQVTGKRLRSLPLRASGASPRVEGLFLEGLPRGPKEAATPV